MMHPIDGSYLVEVLEKVSEHVEKKEGLLVAEEEKKEEEKSTTYKAKIVSVDIHRHPDSKQTQLPIGTVVWFSENEKHPFDKTPDGKWTLINNYDVLFYDEAQNS